MEHNNSYKNSNYTRTVRQRTSSTKSPANKSSRMYSSQQKRRIAKNNIPQSQIKQRHSMRQKKRRIQIIRNRICFGVILCSIFIAILIFLTPIFNIKNIYIEGNNRVTAEQINICISDLKGQNLLKINESLIQKKLEPISYIQNIAIKKSIFPPNVKIIITECEPVGYFNNDGKYTVIDHNEKILEDSVTKPENIPEIINGKEILSQSSDTPNEKKEILIELLTLIKDIEIVDKVTFIDIVDVTDIRFRYEDRMDVLCGSDLDLDRKLRLFKTAIHDSSMSENARGTMDLSVTGYASHIP